MKMRRAEMADLDEVMVIENIGFSPLEAAAREAMEERIEKISDTFIVAVGDGGKICGYVVGPAIYERYLADELFEETIPNPADAPFVSVLSLAVHPDSRHEGLAKALLEELEAVATGQGRKGITLTCLAELVPFYERNGYVNEGVSASQHAGEVWYNMVRMF